MKIDPPKEITPQRLQLGSLALGRTFVLYDDVGVGNMVYMKVDGAATAAPIGWTDVWIPKGFRAEDYVYPVDVLDSRWEFKKP